MKRPTIDAALMAIATIWQDRSTCDRNHVGAVIAKDGRHIGSGYNGAPAGMQHCHHDETHVHMNRPYPSSPGWPLGTVPVDRGCKIAIHAESNAIAYAARNGVAVAGATIYSTLSPCYACAQLIIAAGLTRVVFNRAYRDSSGIELLRSAGLTVDDIHLL